MMTYPIKILMAAAMMLPISVVSVPAVAQSPLSSWFGSKTHKPKFLPVSQAFQVKAVQDGKRLQVHFFVTPEHYIYKDKLTLKLPDGVSMGQWQFSMSPTMVDDPQFGKVPVFAQNVTASTTLHTIADVKNLEAVVRWQGCATAGLCYPPETTKITLSLGATSPKSPTSTAVDDVTLAPSGVSAPKTAISNTEVSSVDEYQKNNNQKVAPDKTKQEEETASVAAKTSGLYTLNHTLQQGASDPFGLGERPVMAVFLLFLAGIVLAFTACVYPMIPIVANIVAQDKSANAYRGLVLTGAYGLGVATSYGLLGAFVAYLGREIGLIGYLQNPWVLLSFALLFVLLALQMFGLIRLGLPSAIKSTLAKASKLADDKLGSVAGSFLVGLLSALVVSPCVSAPLGGALAAMSALGNVFLGFLALFALGLGLSAPLMMVGAAQGRWMPAAGQWMEKVKEFGALMLLLVAILLMNRVFLVPAMLFVWSAWFLVVCVWAWRLAKLPLRFMSVLAGAWAFVLMGAAAQGAVDAWQPLAYLKSQSSTKTAVQTDITVTTLQALDEILVSHPKVLVDVTADWCIECRIMERTLFTNRPQALNGWQVVKLDITESTKESRAILARYQLFGPPALLYYHQGQLKRQQLGEVSRAEFERTLNDINQ